MRIAFIETIFPVGHKKLNSDFCELLQKVSGSLYVVNRKDNYYNMDNKSDYVILNYNLIHETDSFRKNIIINIINNLIVSIYFLFKKDVILIFPTINTIAFSLCRLFYLRKRVLVMHHNNIDLLTSKVFSFFFKTYMNRIEHIVFASFIKERLLDLSVKEENIHIINHPTKISIESNTENKNFVIGLGYASDASLISSIIDYESKNLILSKSGIKLILRSKSIIYSSESIEVINRHLEYEEYLNLYKRSFGVLLLYPETFRYRFSGSMLDALSRGKYVFGPEIPIINHFSMKYPELCFKFCSLDELFSLLTVYKDNGNADFSSYISDYSNEFIIAQIKRMLVKK